MENLKIKPLTKNQLTISIDRLTRFKNTEIKYLRVYKELISNYLILPKIKKQELNKLDYEILRNLAEKIINYSIEQLGIKSNGDYIINQRLFNYENNLFNLSDDVKSLVKNKINYKGFLELINDNSVKNLQWLKVLGEDSDIKVKRVEKHLHFPIEKIIICEGITEETLLPAFGNIYGMNFDQYGIHIISAGGKNQVVKTYYDLSQEIKIPIFVLLDKDAEENLKLIKKRLREIDNIYILTCGEFEDLLPNSLIERTLNYAFQNISQIDFQLLNQNLPKVKILEEIFKNRGLHEFKKSEFANLIKENILDRNDLSDEIKKILENINSHSQIYT